MNDMSEIQKRNKFGLSERDMATIQNIFENYPLVCLVLIFGSRAKGNYKSGSDIDLAIMNESLTDKEIVKLKSDFEESNLPYTVDLVNYISLKHLDLKNHIDRVGQTLYQKNLMVKTP